MGGAGKSTLIKQMHFIGSAGYTHKAKAEFRRLIFWNVLKAVQIIAEAMEALKINYSDASNRVRATLRWCVLVCVVKSVPVFFCMLCWYTFVYVLCK